MLIAGLLLFSTSLLHVKPSPVFADVSIGTAGPYRFLVDTGNQTSLIDAELAAQLKLKPEFRVELVSQNSTRLLPALRLNTLHIGEKRLGEAEVVLQDLAEARRLDPAVKGVLGWNALAGFDFALLPRAGKLDLNASRPDGDVVPFHRIEDRIAITARMGREDLTLILDSGANNVVLFRTPQAMAKSRSVPTNFATVDGARSLAPTHWTADMFFSGGLRIGMLPAAIVSGRATQVDGLLPASVFKTIYVDQSRGEVVLVR
jgi:hypothetical protein